MASDNVREAAVEGESLLDLSALPISPHLLQRIVQKGLCVKCVEYERGCKWEGSLIHMQDHVDKECAYFFMDCPNLCGATGLDVKTLEDHLSKECAEQLVSCKFAEKTGCKHRDKRKNMPAHENNAEKHLALMENAMMNLKKENKFLKQENKILKGTSCASESQNESMESVDMDTGNAVSLLGLKQSDAATRNGHQAFSSDEFEETERKRSQDEVDNGSSASEEEETLPTAPPAKKKRQFSSERSEICKRMCDFKDNPCPRELCKMKKMIKSSPVLLCKSCNRWCHAHCANIHAVQAPKLKYFICPLCKKA